MAIEYAKVLKYLNEDFIVIGRGVKSAKIFTETTNIKVHLNDIDKFLSENNHNPSYAIVAVTGDQLGNVARTLIQYGFKKILLEKPGGLNNEDIISLGNEAKKFNSKVLIAFNRRFYTSVIKAKEIIQKDGGASSFNFEFTEWSHIIEGLDKNEEIKNLWLLHNSSHVIDLAFYLGGSPQNIKCFVSGSLKWHPRASVFTGAGVTEEGVLFSYHSNWDAPGRWSVEILTKFHRLILCPLEKLIIQKKASVDREYVKIDDWADKKFKPGLYQQVKAFLNDNYNNFIDINEQVKKLKLYDTISKGNV